MMQQCIGYEQDPAYSLYGLFIHYFTCTYCEQDPIYVRVSIFKRLWRVINWLLMCLATHRKSLKAQTDFDQTYVVHTQKNNPTLKHLIF